MLRGEEVDWQKIEDSMMPRKRCVGCDTRKQKTYFTKCIVFYSMLAIVFFVGGTHQKNKIIKTIVFYGIFVISCWLFGIVGLAPGGRYLLDYSMGLAPGGPGAGRTSHPSESLPKNKRTAQKQHVFTKFIA